MDASEFIDEWERQTGMRATPAERRFIEAMREARMGGVGYGWMRQVIGVEWKHVDQIAYIDDDRIREMSAKAGAVFVDPALIADYHREAARDSALGTVATQIAIAKAVLSQLPR
jgi:hypothetical protein